MKLEERARVVFSDLELDERQYIRILIFLDTEMRHAVEDERAACALACDVILDDKHAQFKGRPPHAPNNEHRADPYTEGESDGAGLCVLAIRQRGKESRG